MMIDGKGCLVIWVAATVFFGVIGIILNWLGLIPMWAVAGCAALPTALVAAFAILLAINSWFE